MNPGKSPKVYNSLAFLEYYINLTILYSVKDLKDYMTNEKRKKDYDDYVNENTYDFEIKKLIKEKKEPFSDILDKPTIISAIDKFVKGINLSSEELLLKENRKQKTENILIFCIYWKF